MNLIDTRFGAMRLDVMNVLDKAVYPRGFNDVDEGGIYLSRFDVERTVDRKGYRSARSGFYIPEGDTGYTEDPRIRVTIELEMEDGAIPDLPELIARLDNQRKIDLRERLKAEVADAQERSAKAHDDYVKAQAKLNALDGVAPQ